MITSCSLQLCLMIYSVLNYLKKIFFYYRNYSWWLHRVWIIDVQVMITLRYRLVTCLYLPSSNECLATDVPVRPIDLTNVAFEPEGGSDDPGP